MIKRFISFLEERFPVAAKVAIALSIVTLIALLSYNPVDTTKATVMITRLDGKSGGSGVVLNSRPGHSEILTNRHICKVIKNGGIISTADGLKATVSSFRESQVHDLCLITTSADMHAFSVLAEHAPRLMDKALIKGHPALLPTLLTEGIFSANMIIPVVVGFRECTDQDLNNPQKAAFCLFVGRIPVIRNYETTVVSALIMGGSSGSAVYNSKNELSALVFAGSGNSVSFAFTVPYGNIKMFLEEEFKRLVEQYPNYNVDIVSIEQEQNKSTYYKIVDFCEQPNNKENEVCLTLNITRSRLAE
jgi:hypothetical protein